MRFEVWLIRVGGNPPTEIEKVSSVPFRFHEAEEVAEFIHMNCDGFRERIEADIKDKAWKRQRDGGTYPIAYGEDKQLAYNIHIIQETPKSLQEAAIKVKERISKMSREEILENLDKWHARRVGSGIDGEYEELQDFARFLSTETELFDVFFVYDDFSYPKKLLEGRGAFNVADFLGAQSKNSREAVLQDIKSGDFVETKYEGKSVGYYFIEKTKTESER